MSGDVVKLSMAQITQEVFDLFRESFKTAEEWETGGVRLEDFESNAIDDMSPLIYGEPCIEVVSFLEEKDEVRLSGIYRVERPSEGLYVQAISPCLDLKALFKADAIKNVFCPLSILAEEVERLYSDQIEYYCVDTAWGVVDFIFDVSVCLLYNWSEGAKSSRIFLRDGSEEALSEAVMSLLDQIRVWHGQPVGKLDMSTITSW